MTMSPGRTSRPQCSNDDELHSVRKPIDLRSDLTATVLISGSDMWIRCIQSPFMPTCTISAWKFPFAVGNSWTSAEGKTASQADGSSRLKSLINATLSSPAVRKYCWSGQLLPKDGRQEAL